MAKTKINFERTKPKPNRSLKEQGILMDPGQIGVRNKKVEVSKDQLNDELARDWATAKHFGDKLSPKRQIRVLEKALTAPAFDDTLIPLRTADNDEVMYFMALIKTKDTVLFIQDLLYDEMFNAEQQRRIAEKQEKESKQNEKID